MVRGGDRRDGKEDEKGQGQKVLGSSWQVHQAGICGVTCRYCLEAFGLPPRQKEPQ